MTTTETSTSELDAFKATVRSTAAEYLRAGYGNREEWNKLLVHCGLEPMTVRQMVVKAQIPAAINKPVDIPAEYADSPERWLERNGGAKAFVSVYDLQPHLNDAEVEYEIVEAAAPGIEGEEPDEKAGTDDLKVFKRLVYKEGIRLQGVFGWCEGGTSDVFERVGLPRINSISIPVDLTTTQRIRVFAPGAMDMDEARAMLEAGELTEVVRQHVNTRQEVVSAVPADPNVHHVGDPDPTGWASQRGNSVRRARDYSRCAAEDPKGTGYGCTFEPDHGGDQHVAGSYGEIISVWPKQA